jgi:hypothetical protein
MYNDYHSYCYNSESLSSSIKLSMTEQEYSDRSIEDTQIPSCDDRLVHLDNVRQVQLEIMPGRVIQCLSRSQSTAAAFSPGNTGIVCMRLGGGLENGGIGGIPPVASTAIDANGKLPQGRAECLLQFDE